MTFFSATVFKPWCEIYPENDVRIEGRPAEELEFQSFPNTLELESRHRLYRGADIDGNSASPTPVHINAERQANER